MQIVGTRQQQIYQQFNNLLSGALLHPSHPHYTSTYFQSNSKDLYNLQTNLFDHFNTIIHITRKQILQIDIAHLTPPTPALENTHFDPSNFPSDKSADEQE